MGSEGFDQVFVVYPGRGCWLGLPVGDDRDRCSRYRSCRRFGGRWSSFRHVRIGFLELRVSGRGCSFACGGGGFPGCGGLFPCLGGSMSELLASPLARRTSERVLELV